MLAALAVVVVASGCGGGDSDDGAASPAAVPTWPAPPDPLKRAVRAGLEPERKETLTYHVHAHLDALVDGRPVLVPAGIGINVDDPGVQRSFDPRAFGGIKLCAAPCISPLHTHDESGVIHTETATPKPNTLGQFFVEWGVKLDSSCVGEFCRPETPIEVYVEGRKRSGDPREILLTDREEIAIVIGEPPSRVPDSYDF